MTTLTICPGCLEPAAHRTTPHGETYVSCDHCLAITFDDGDPDEPASEFYAQAQAPVGPTLSEGEPNEPLTTRRVSVGWDAKYHPDLACIAARVLLPLAHLGPVLSAHGDYLLINTRAEIVAPADDHAIVTCLIDALNAVAAQLPARPDSITASLHIGGELYQVGHNGPAAHAHRPR